MVTPPIHKTIRIRTHPDMLNPTHEFAICLKVTKLKRITSKIYVYCKYVSNFGGTWTFWTQQGRDMNTPRREVTTTSLKQHFNIVSVPIGRIPIILRFSQKSIKNNGMLRLLDWSLFCETRFESLSRFFHGPVVPKFIFFRISSKSDGHHAGISIFQSRAEADQERKPTHGPQIKQI